MNTVLQSSLFEGITQVTINRPEKRNALDNNLIRDLTQTFKQLAQDAATRIVVLTGNGEHFCAGADIAWMQHMAGCDHTENVQDAKNLATLLRTLQEFPKPIIALVQGATMGGGLGVIACCDMVVAADNAAFCFSEVKMGLTPSVISPYVIPVIGARAARYYYLTAERFDVHAAIKLHLVQHVTSPTTLTDVGYALAHTLMQNSPHALVEAKKLIRYVADESSADMLMEYTTEHLATMRASADATEGLQAFLQKRTPVWR